MGTSASKISKAAADAARSSISRTRQELQAQAPGGPFGYAGKSPVSQTEQVEQPGADGGPTGGAAVPPTAPAPAARGSSQLGTYKPAPPPPARGDATGTRVVNRPSLGGDLHKARPLVSPVQLAGASGAEGALAPVPAPPPADPAFNTVPYNTDAAEVQRMVTAAHRLVRPAAGDGEPSSASPSSRGGEGEEGGEGGEGEGASTTTTVAVTRLMSSGPVPLDAAKLHEKSAVTVENVTSMDGSVQELPSLNATDPGMRNIPVWTAMQENPELADMPMALAGSATGMATLGVLQLAAGNVSAAPAGTVLKRSAAVAAAPPAPAPLPSPGTGVEAAAHALVVAEAAADALVPVGKALDVVLLSVLDPAALVESWGNRPSEGSVYDQLILMDREEELLLDRAELFELFARARADPGHWTPVALAEFYGTRPDWVAALLDSVSPPIFAVVEGEAYGVYDIRPEEEYGTPLQKQGKGGSEPVMR